MAIHVAGQVRIDPLSAEPEKDTGASERALETTCLCRIQEMLLGLRRLLYVG